MLLLIRLLNMSPKIARAFRDFAIGFAAWTHADLDALKKWFDSTPKQQQQMLQEQSTLNQNIEAVFASYQKHVDTQHEILALKREIGKMPALPDEGY
ncbi:MULTISPECIES: hypothetical protein [unclassified Bradyrhizobium]|uniref:hypothetical protein n=1 Tax=unclassified Bradyrhizobium TaxID=2631580 RepID=UPI0028E881E5|nr:MULTISPECIES: hypothetical protein [unclassified Bradyrhizobium]